MKLKTWQKNILSAIVIVVAGFILFNLAFLLAAFVINGVSRIMGLPENASPIFGARVVYVIIVFLISWLVFRSKFNDLLKATYLTMPLMVILVTYSRKSCFLLLICVYKLLKTQHIIFVQSNVILVHSIYSFN